MQIKKVKKTTLKSKKQVFYKKLKTTWDNKNQ